MKDPLTENTKNSQRNYSRGSRWALSLKVLLALILACGVIAGFYKFIKSTYLDRRISRFTPSTWVNLNEKNNAEPVSKDLTEKPVFRVAIAPIVSPEKSHEMYQGFVDYIAEKLGRKPVSLYRPTYSETSDLVRYQRCDIAVVCTYPFIRGEREFGMQALVVPQIKGETTYQSFIIVPKSSSAKSLFDLRGSRFAAADIISTTGWLFPAMTIMNAGENPNRFFGNLIITGSHDKSIQAVMDGFVDGAAVHGIVYDQMTADNPSIPNKIRIIGKSPPFGIPPVVAHPGMDPNLRKATISILLDMHNNDRGKKILDGLQIERFVVPQKGLFDDLRQAIGKLEGWK
jgi:phosphonate transport system substrate-binding protein